MEEILASIRRIISEDDAPAGEAEAAPAPAPAPEPAPVVAAAPAPAPEREPEPADDELELTQRVDAPAESVGDIEAYKPAPAPEPPPVVAAAPAPRPAPVEDEDLVSAASASAAASAFGNLTAAISMPTSGRTLEDVVRELLRPMLKAWLDENLPRIVEAKVAEEVERIARIRVR